MSDVREKKERKAKEDDAEREKKRAERRERREKKEKKKEKSDKKEKKSKKSNGSSTAPSSKTPATTTTSSTPTAPTPAAQKLGDSSILGEDVNQVPIESAFVLGRQLGSGAFSVVKEAVSKKDGQKVAIKIIQKTTVAGEDIKLLRREIQNLKTLDHPNILHLYEVYEDKQQFYLVMELVQGQELFDKIVARGQYSERDASHITRQFVLAIDYLHSKGIAHRDLKPENIMSIGTGENEIIKVADFGLSKNFGDEKMMTSCGSPGYVAPEVLECETYDKSVDMWSIGVILYILLVGYPPFFADSDPALFKKIMACDYSFGEGWENVSESAKDLVKNLLVKDVKKRYTTTQTLNHPWLKSGKELSQKQLQMTKLRDYVTTNKLKK